MKFQSVFIAFNILLVFFLTIIILSPMLFLGNMELQTISQNSTIIAFFLRSNWVLMIILALILAGFDVFYLLNRKLYALLEKEDWPALVNYLEDQILRQGKYSSRLVRLLANTYLVLSDSAAVMSLENKAAMAKPSLVDDSALIFGTARILGKDIAGAARFFEARLKSVKPPLRQWVNWYFAFSLLLGRKYENACEEFIRLISISNDGIIIGLSVYFLSNTIRKLLPEQKEALDAAILNGKMHTKKSLPTHKKWTQETGKISAEIHIAVLSQYINETGKWLYEESE